MFFLRRTDENGKNQEMLKDDKDRPKIFGHKYDSHMDEVKNNGITASLNKEIWEEIRKLRTEVMTKSKLVSLKMG